MPVRPQLQKPWGYMGLPVLTVKGETLVLVLTARS